ncbi:MAG: outer membrane protein assembly factor BamB [Verrucomicrobiales bacterium]
MLTTHQPVTAICASDGIEIWSANGGDGVPSAAIWDGRVYVYSHYLQCLDLKTGASVYGERVPDIKGRVYASLLAADGKIYLTTSESGVIVLEAGPGFKVLAHNRIAGDQSKFNASPAVSGNQVYFRSDKALYCVGE